MNNIYIIKIIIIFLFSFFSGSIPTGYILVKKIKGIDVRSIGSGNIGSTNVRRVVGRKISIITQVIDILKGTIPVIIAHYCFLSNVISFGAGFFAIAGHCFTPFLKFKGGKGVNTTIGAFIFLAPIPTLISLCAYLLFRLTTRIVSLGSIAFSLSLSICVILYTKALYPSLISILVSFLIILKHKDNIIRLIHHQEKAIS